jgi:hypothetical protein
MPLVPFLQASIVAAIDNAARLDRDWLSPGMSDSRKYPTLQRTERQEHRPLPAQCGYHFGFGSTCEELTVSKSSPLHPAKRTHVGRAATSQTGHFLTPKRATTNALFNWLAQR